MLTPFSPLLPRESDFQEEFVFFSLNAQVAAQFLHRPLHGGQAKAKLDGELDETVIL